MEEQRILFVVGAGASTEFGLPTGRGLLEQISNQAQQYMRERQSGFRMPDQVAEALSKVAQRNAPSDPSTYFTKLQHCAVWIARNAHLAPSIDNLLHSHRDSEFIPITGKILIAHCLLEAERSSVIAPSTETNSDPFSFLWHSRPINNHSPDQQISGSNSWISRVFWLLAEESNFDDFLTRLSLIDFICFN